MSAKVLSALRYPKQHCFMKAPILPPLCLSCNCGIKMKMSMELSGMILTGENRSDRRKSCPIAPSPSTLLTCSGQGSNWPSAAKGWWQTTWNKGYKKVKVLFYPMLPYFRKALIFGKFLGSPLVSLPCRNVEHWWTDSGGEVEVLGEKLVSTPLCRPEISLGVTWDRTGPLR